MVLAHIASLHLYWALGGLWPGKDERSQARTVIGAAGIERMPPKPVTAAVAAAIYVAAIFPLMWAALIPYAVPQTLVWMGMVALTLVFIGRGLAGYTNAFRSMNPELPFATLDRRYFSPLCLAIGAGFAILIYLGAYA